MNYPLPVFDEDMEFSSQDVQQEIFTLAHECRLSLEQFRAFTRHVIEGWRCD